MIQMHKQNERESSGSSLPKNSACLRMTDRHWRCLNLPKCANHLDEQLNSNLRLVTCLIGEIDVFCFSLKERSLQQASASNTSYSTSERSAQSGLSANDISTRLPSTMPERPIALTAFNRQKILIKIEERARHRYFTEMFPIIVFDYGIRN